MNKLMMWFRQPTTISGLALAVGAGVYWFTNSGTLASIGAALVLGSVNDHTFATLKAVERVEDALRAQTANPTAAIAKQIEGATNVG